MSFLDAVVMIGSCMLGGFVATTFGINKFLETLGEPTEMFLDEDGNLKPVNKEDK